MPTWYRTNMENKWDGEEAEYNDDCDRMPSKLEAIVGMTVVEASMGGEVLVLSMNDGGAWLLTPEGECCSKSYWAPAEFNGIENLIGSPVLRVVNRYESTDSVDELSYDGEICGEKFVKVYALELVTAKGSAVFELRNESNGYYGGTYSARWEAL